MRRERGGKEDNNKVSRFLFRSKHTYSSESTELGYGFECIFVVQQSDKVHRLSFPYEAVGKEEGRGCEEVHISLTSVRPGSAGPPF